MSKKQWTGERLETHIAGETMLEHLHRYALAAEFVKGKHVLDIACGEGYGANLLSQTAAKITAIDADEPVIKAAATKYADSGIEFKAASILNIPADAASFDVIACFETLEHVLEHEKVMLELKRVLKPGGVLLISTPEKENYSDKPEYSNPYHKKELYGYEFKELITRHFSHAHFYNQLSSFASWMVKDGETQLSLYYTGNYEEIKRQSGIPWKYCFAIASDSLITPLPSGMFNHQSNMHQLLHEQTEELKKTTTYRTGTFILAPFKFFLSLFKK